MHTGLDVAAREAALLALLLLTGAGPASWLGERFDAGSRIAMAPLLGFALGTCLTTTLLQFWPTNSTYWVLIPLAIGSTGVAAIRTVRGSERPFSWGHWRRRLPIGDVLTLVLVGVAVCGPLTYTLRERDSVGPATYYFTDADSYVGVQDAMRTESLGTAHSRWNATTGAFKDYPNLTQWLWGFYSQIGSNLDAGPLDSNLNALLGLGATATFAPFLTVLLLMGALAAVAVVRYFAGRRPWMAALAGCLFGGAMFIELWFDSYQAAIIAIGMITPFVVLIDSALRTRRRADMVLLALLVAAYWTVYPLYMALLVGGTALLLLGRALLLWRSGGQPAGGWWRGGVRPLAIAVVGIVVLSAVLDAIGFIRDVHYYDLVLKGEIGLPRVGYSLRLPVIPGWVLQTRDFWGLEPMHSFKQVILGVVIPLLMIGLMFVALWRYRITWALVALAAFAAVFAEYSYVSQQQCTYCAERVMVSFGPIAAVLIAVGLCALLATPQIWVRVLGVLGVLLVVGAVGERARIEFIRFANDSYFLDSADRTLLAKLPARPGSVLEEGFGASTAAQAEQPLVYHLIYERSGKAPSIILGTAAGNANQYLTFGTIIVPPAPQFDPGYRYVLTRLSGVATDRRTIGRIGSFAIQERTDSLDVTPYSGLAVPLGRLDQAGSAFVQTYYMGLNKTKTGYVPVPLPLKLVVSGSNGNRPTWARLTFTSARPATVHRQGGVSARAHGAHTLVACVRATGKEPVRYASIQLTYPVTTGVPPSGLYPPAMPLEGLELTAMRAVSGHCSP